MSTAHFPFLCRGRILLLACWRPSSRSRPNQQRPFRTNSVLSTFHCATSSARLDARRKSFLNRCARLPLDQRLHDHSEAAQTSAEQDAHGRAKQDGEADWLDVLPWDEMTKEVW